MKTFAIPGVLALTLAACAGTPPAAVPGQLEPGRHETLAMSVAASGVQVYECRDGPSAGAPPQWIFVAPEARLFDTQGRPIGSHGAGPHWLADDGSRLQGTVRARADAPSAGAIPWLLLATTGSGPRGRFSGVSSIQRINTSGGAAPSEGCHAGATGSVARIPYTADYRLFRAATADTGISSAR
jgi:hypothetical protein